MEPDLADLRVTEKQIESLSGIEVTEQFIGGMFGGAYRSSIFRSPTRTFNFGLTQLFMLVLAFILSLPLGLLSIRNASRAINDLPTIIQFLQITVGASVIVFVGWNAFAWFKMKSFKTLAHLLDDIDRFNEIIQTIDVMDRLEAISTSQITSTNRTQILEALTVARNSLICGLMTDRILRENRSLLARRYDLFTTIETNLATLRSLEVRDQANEYVELFHEAFQIGLSVHQEVQQFSPRH